jgi:hypothetical protein
VTRSDGSTFDGKAADDVLAMLQYALSFAAGYWIGEVLPVGSGSDGEMLWTHWGAPHVGRAQRGSGWWNDCRPEDLAELVGRFGKLWRRPAPTDPLRFAVTSSILANESGFVEQRLITAIAALEHLSWTHEVLEHGKDERGWRKSGPKRLRRQLVRMKVDPTFTTNPGRESISRYGQGLGHHDLAESVMEVRNRVVHPKPGHDVYADTGVLREAWRLATFWLELTILHRLGFAGQVSDRGIPGRWAGTSEAVPWA